MDGTRFDAMVRSLGEARSRRGFLGLVAAMAAGGAVAGADARRRCRKDSPTGQCCKRRGGVVTCTCDNGGTACGANCCLLGQECRDGQCVELPEPTTCVAYGEPCKNVGKPCCENLVCGSGQGGENDVACYVRKTGHCTSTAECTFGTECVGGACVGLPVCTVQLGQPCVASDICCTGTCGPTAVVGSRVPDLENRCCVAVGASCGEDLDCCQPFVLGGGSPRIDNVVACRDGVCEHLLD